jgi:hypothetical protein
MPVFVQIVAVVIVVLLVAVIGIALLGAYLEAQENRAAKRDFFELRPKTERLMTKVRAMVQRRREKLKRCSKW